MRESIILMGMDILQPVVALMIWTMIIWAWMYATRLPAMQRAQIEPDEAQKATLLDQKLPPQVQWKAHNYNHLHEQPTVFYAVAIVLAIVGAGDGMNAFLGWIYVGLRITHSLVQVTANKVIVRFVLFAISSLVLIALIFNAAMIVFGAGTELQGSNFIRAA
ncbi:MAG: MAPEG family protein [Erythrobacter sp.]|uniref:MAPEG family protein n=1 Tax=Erythrobacter sp. TaxID=1042 RepID=UPI0026197C7D|nr:MAPEG family protein [Erythrobacter sp.]MDJ0977315.1 MAPEG family protein [Erythrobacter sp.]